MTDRVAVFHGGKISGIVNTHETTQEHIMHLASGSGARSQT
jgi:ribose transport system ATP-binding protein